MRTLNDTEKLKASAGLAFLIPVGIFVAKAAGVATVSGVALAAANGVTEKINGGPVEPN